MPKEIIGPSRAGEPVAPYSQGIRAGDFIFISGQGAFHPETGRVVGRTVTEQAERVFENVKAILEAGGATMADVVKVQTFLTTFDHFEEYNAVWLRYFQPPFPTRSTATSKLPWGVLIEMDVIAYAPQAK